MFIGIISVLLILTNILLKKSKLLYIITFLFMWLLMAGTYGIADESIYISRYNSPELWTATSEILYEGIILCCRMIGMNFIQFKILITFLQLLLIFKTVWSFSKYPNMVIALYFLFPFPLHIAQMRNALATAIFVFGMRYLISEDNSIKIKKLRLTIDDIKYIGIVMVAACVHTLSIGWLILLIAKKTNLKFNVLFAILANLLIYFVISPENILKVINIFGAGNRISAYFSLEYQLSSYRQYGSLYGIIFTACLMIGISIYILYKQKFAQRDDGVMFVLKSNIVILFIVSVVLRYTAEIYRLQEGMTILNILLLTNSLKFLSNYRIVKIKKNTFYVICGLLVYFLGIFWIRIIRYLLPSILFPILQNNMFLP